MARASHLSFLNVKRGIDKLKRELRAAHKDAERYLFLKSHGFLDTAWLPDPDTRIDELIAKVKARTPISGKERKCRKCGRGQLHWERRQAASEKGPLLFLLVNRQGRIHECKEKFVVNVVPATEIK